MNIYKHNYVYKTTNKINGKFYIGVHSTNNLEDGYLGSGAYIKKAIEKYGRENFTKEILKFFDGRDAAFEYEKNIVTESFIQNPISYNGCVGGQGGAGALPKTDKHKENISKSQKKRYSLIGGHSMKGTSMFRGVRRSPQSEFKPGHKPKNAGMVCVNNGEKMIYVYPNSIPEGFSRGRLKLNKSPSRNDD